MRIPSIAIHTTMLTTLIGIQGIFHPQIRTFYFVDYSFRENIFELGFWVSGEFIVFQVAIFQIFRIGNMLQLKKPVVNSFLCSSTFLIFLFHQTYLLSKVKTIWINSNKMDFRIVPFIDELRYFLRRFLLYLFPPAPKYEFHHLLWSLRQLFLKHKHLPLRRHSQ